MHPIILYLLNINIIFGCYYLILVLIKRKLNDSNKELYYDNEFIFFQSYKVLQSKNKSINRNNFLLSVEYTAVIC